MKPLSSMTEAEKRALLSNEPVEEVSQEDEDLFEAIEEKLKTQPPIYQDASKDRQHFLSSIVKKPKKGILGIFSKDEPNELSKYPKNLGKVENFDINKPGEVLKPQKQSKGLLKEILVAIVWVFHLLTVVGSIGLTYYMITLLRGGVTELPLFAVIVSIQISLIGVCIVLGGVVRK
jgi:hypothetical protein